MDQLQHKIDAQSSMLRYVAWFTASLSRQKKLPDLRDLIKTHHNEPKSRDEKIAGFRTFFGKANENVKVRKMKKQQRKERAGQNG